MYEEEKIKEAEAAKLQQELQQVKLHSFGVKISTLV
jgi:hypothetical protein